MGKTLAAITILAALLAACATPAPGPTPTPTPAQVAVEPAATAPPTSTPAPSATPTISPADQACVRATTEIPEGQNPTRFITSGPASGCYDIVGDFLDDIGLAWEEFAPGTMITFWTLWPVDPQGAIVYPTATPTPVPPSPTAVPTPTPTPDPWDLQVYFGIPAAALRFDSCGDAVFISQDHDPREGIALSYWDRYPEVPKPPYAYRTKDGRRVLDICTWPGFPITFLQEEGRVTQIRLKGGLLQDTVIDILITKGIGAGLHLGYGHTNADIDLTTPGLQQLQVGDIVHRGDVIAHTGEGSIPESGTPTNISLLAPGFEGVYHRDQEIMYIGPDGLPNILW